MKLLVEQARDLIVGQPLFVRGHGEGFPCVGGIVCVETHNLGKLNGSGFDGDTALYGPTAPGWLCGHWDIHGSRYIKLTGMFPAPDAGVWTEDLSDALVPTA